MQYKPAPRLEYHHVQPLTLIQPPHSPGDLNLLAMRERRKLQPVPKPQRPASRPCIITFFAIPGPEPEPEPEPITVPTPYGAITIDPAPHSITQAVARPRAGGGLRHTIRCWMNNLFGGW
jgi:hypothetical protein